MDDGQEKVWQENGQFLSGENDGFDDPAVHAGMGCI